jgi:hypothetical protein
MIGANSTISTAARRDPRSLRRQDAGIELARLVDHVVVLPTVSTSGAAAEAPAVPAVSE